MRDNPSLSISMESWARASLSLRVGPASNLEIAPRSPPVCLLAPGGVVFMVGGIREGSRAEAAP